MGEVTFWDRLRWWLRHPIHQAAEAIAVRYCERNGLEMDYAGEELDRG